MEFFNVVKATQKSGKKDAVIWFTEKTEARANLRLDVELEDAGIETGRGKDYQKAIRTDFPVFSDLPEEGTVDYTWCERYELADDLRTWHLKPGAAPQDNFHQEDVADNDLTTELMAEENGDRKVEYSNNENAEFQLATMPFRIQLLAQLCAETGHVYHISIPRRKELSALEMDTDNTYVQNLLLAAENASEVKTFDIPTLWKFTAAVKAVFPQDKRCEMSLVMRFIRMWVSVDTNREMLVKKWQEGSRECVLNTPAEEPKKDAEPANEVYKRAVAQNLANLSIEIAIAQLYPDALPGKISRPQLVGAKELADRKEPVHAKALKVLGKITDILDYDANTIYGVTRAIPWNGEETTSELRGLVREWLTAHGIYEAGGRSKGYPEWDEDSRANRQAKVEEPSSEQPQIASMGNGMFSIDGLMNAPAKQPEETTSDEQMEETERAKGETNDAVSAGEGAVEDDQQTDTVDAPAIQAAAAPSLAAEEQSVPKVDSAPEEATPAPEETTSAPEEPQPAPVAEYPAFFEPGRYEGLPNEVYHAANGISSTQVKDARVSLMYFNARHVEKTITKERSPVLDMGNLVHALALQPEQLDAEFSVEPVIPEGAFTTTATIRAFIDEHNASLPALLSADDIKALLEAHNAALVPPLSIDEIKAQLEAHNATLPAQIPAGTSIEETGQHYMELPPEFQRIEEGQKQTASAMKACIKEYNATLPTPMKFSGSRETLLVLLSIINPELVELESQKTSPLKTSGSRDALLEQLAVINPDLVAQEAQKPQPLKVSGTKADLIQAVKSVNPGAVFADELLDAWRENPEGKVLVTRQQLSTALNIQKALLQHPTAGKLLTHPSRAVEVSYFGFDDETGLEVRVRPDLEIDLDGVRIGADLKTISMWNIKQEGLRAKLHREIIDRDYHLSAAMYCETAALDQFFWIFVNKDENYHWIAIIEASVELLELGMLEYRKVMRAIATGFDTGEWPAPITADYTDELNDFDMRRLEALRLA